ncbi:unnamed protein product, partial [Iphiclides podalirius]
MVGYGITTKTLPDGEIITDDTLILKKPLQVLKVLVIKCEEENYKDSQFCLAPRCGQVATVCGGDSGGPLIHPSGMIGVLVLSEATGFCLDATEKRRVRIVGYISPVSRYIDWIKNSMEE